MGKRVRDKDLYTMTGSFPYQALRGMRTKLLLLIQLLFWILMATASQAATYTVNSTDDEADTNPGDLICQTASVKCSLRAAIQTANATPNSQDAFGVTQPDVIAIPAGTYTLTIGGASEDLEDPAATGDLDITESVDITGDGSNNTIIDGNNSDRVFQIMSGAKVSISGVTIQHGFVTNDNGGGINNSGILTLNSSTISSNVVDTIVSGGGGGGIYNQGDLTLENCTIDSNRAGTGTAAGGGGIQNEGATGVGSNTVRTTIIGSTVSNNTAPLGAGVRNLFGRVDIDISVIESNTADFSGGGVENVGGSATISRTAIRNNTAPQNGGGIDNLGAMDIGNSTIYGNQTLGINPGGTGGAGAGVFNSGDGILNLFNSTISGNNALIGGGIYNHREILSTNSTIFDNSATSGGSEVYACGNKDESLGLGCDNGITDSAENIVIHTKFVNTIVGNTSTSTNCDGDVAHLITSNGHNIETANSCGFASTGDMSNVATSSLFDSGLADNGGSVPSLLTFSIPTTSPAHNAADLASCPVIDERGFKRDEGDGLCDIGAYEISTTANFAVLDLALDIQYKSATPQNGAVQTTITLTVLNKGPLKGTNIVLTGKLPSSLAWLKITSLTAGASGGTCSLTPTGFTCTIASIDAYKSADFFLAVLVTQAGSFVLDAEVTSDQADNFRPDNTKSITVTIPTVDSSTSGGNNFSGSGGGGIMDWLSLMVLLTPAARRIPRH